MLTQAGGFPTRPRVRADPRPRLLTHINITLSPFSLPAQRTMGYAAPGGVVSVVLTTSFLIKNIHHRHGERGCSRDHPRMCYSEAKTCPRYLIQISLQLSHSDLVLLKKGPTNWGFQGSEIFAKAELVFIPPSSPPRLFSFLCVCMFSRWQFAFLPSLLRMAFYAGAWLV